MNLEKIKERLISLGAKKVRAQDAMNVNDPNDRLGLRLEPIFIPAVIEAEGVTKEQIDTVVAEVEAEEQAKIEEQEDQFAEKILKALERLKDKGKLDKVLKVKGER